MAKTVPTKYLRLHPWGYTIHEEAKDYKGNDAESITGAAGVQIVRQSAVAVGCDPFEWEKIPRTPENLAAMQGKPGLVIATREEK